MKIVQITCILIVLFGFGACTQVKDQTEESMCNDSAITELEDYFNGKFRYWSVSKSKGLKQYGEVEFGKNVWSEREVHHNRVQNEVEDSGTFEIVKARNVWDVPEADGKYVLVLSSDKKQEKRYYILQSDHNAKKLIEQYGVPALGMDTKRSKKIQEYRKLSMSSDSEGTMHYTLNNKVKYLVPA